MLFRDGLHNISGCIRCSAMRLCHFAEIVNSTSPFPCVCMDLAIALLSGIPPKWLAASWRGHFHWPHGFYSLLLVRQETTVRRVNSLILPCCGKPGHAEKHRGVKHRGLRVEEWDRQQGARGIGHGRKAVVLEVDSRFWPHPLVPHGAQPRHLLTVFLMVLQQYATWQLKKKS